MQEYGVERVSRNREIDVLRGIGCVYVVLGHLHPGELEAHIYSFHMFLFFFLSGYLHKKKTMKAVIISGTKTLLLPFLCAGVLSHIVSLLLHEPIQGNLIQSLFYINGELTWNRPIWFLLVLFEATLITHLIERWSFLYIVSIGLCTLYGYFLQNTNYSFGLSILPVAYSWIGIGYISKKYLSRLFDIEKKYQLLIIMIAAAANYCCTYRLNTRISVLGSYYGNYIFAFIAGYFGIIMYWFIAKLIARNSMLETLGKHGVAMLSTQYLILKILQKISTASFGYDIWREVSLMKAIPVTAAISLCYYTIFIVSDRTRKMFKPTT